jgi:membrane protein implicated in regulation of membrane protease activity
MLAPLMKYQVIVFTCWIVLFGVVGAVLAAVDAPPWALTLAIFAIVAAQQIYCQRPPVARRAQDRRGCRAS